MSGEGAQTFRVSPAAYDRHIGRYGPALAQGLIELAGIQRTDRVLDVGCGTGLLTAALVSVVGADRVAAIDPSEPFVAACRERVPGVDVRLGAAEDLPFEDAAFDGALSQLVLAFMSDPLGGVQHMRRVTRPGGTVAASVWDLGGEMTLLRAFWDAARALDAGAAALDEARSTPHSRPESLRELWQAAGLRDVTGAELRPAVRYSNFEELWAPFTAGVGPAGAYTTSRDEAGQDALRRELWRRLGSPDGSFVLTARAWVVIGRH